MGTSTLLRWLTTCTLLISTSFVMADDAIAADSEAGKIRSAICIGRKGRQPACMEACPTGARVFGNLLDPDSEIRWILRTRRFFV